MKFVKMLCLMLCVSLLGLLLASCHMLPPGLYENVEFVVTDAVLGDMKAAIEGIDAKPYYMQIDGNTEQNWIYGEEVYISDDCVACYATSITNEETAYLNGAYYTIENGEAIVREDTFSTEKFTQYMEDSCQLLEQILSDSSEKFTVLASYIPSFYETEDILVTLEYGEGEDGALLDFIYYPESDTYSSFVFAWNNSELSFYVMFDLAECPEELLVSIPVPSAEL